MSIMRNNNVIADSNGNILTPLTRAEYNALEIKDPNKYYVITDDTNVSVSLLEMIYPVGSIYITTTNSCPLSVFFGTWQLVGSDKVLQGAGTRGSVGSYLSESLPNIKGDWGSQGAQGPCVNEEGGGAVTRYAKKHTFGAGHDTGSSSHFYFDASGSSSAYKDNAPVQPDAYLVNIFRRIA